MYFVEKLLAIVILSILRSFMSFEFALELSASASFDQL